MNNPRDPAPEMIEEAEFLANVAHYVEAVRGHLFVLVRNGKRVCRLEPVRALP